MLTVELEDHQSPASGSSDIPRLIDKIVMYLHLLAGFRCDRPHEVTDFTCMDLSKHTEHSMESMLAGLMVTAL